MKHYIRYLFLGSIICKPLYTMEGIESPNIPFKRSKPIPIRKYHISQADIQHMEYSYKKRETMNMDSLPDDEREHIVSQQHKYAELLTLYYQKMSEINPLCKEASMYWQQEAARYKRDVIEQNETVEHYSHEVAEETPLVEALSTSPIAITYVPAEEKPYAANQSMVSIKSNSIHLTTKKEARSPHCTIQ